LANVEATEAEVSKEGVSGYCRAEALLPIPPPVKDLHGI